MGICGEVYIGRGGKLGVVMSCELWLMYIRRDGET